MNASLNAVQTVRRSQFAIGAIVLLFATAAFAASAAAETPAKGPAARPGVSEVTLTLVFNPHDQPERIYASFKRSAQRICTASSPSTFQARAAADDCADELVAAAVKRLGRADVAAIATETAGS